MNADGSGQRNLTRSPANEGWLPGRPRRRDSGGCDDDPIVVLLFALALAVGAPAGKCGRSTCHGKRRSPERHRRDRHGRL